MISLENICKTYGKGNVAVEALKDVSLEISRGEFVSIMGESGSGKSTLLNVLGFLDRPDCGSYKILDIDVARFSDDDLAYLRNRLVSFVFQQFHLLRRASALENVELPLVYANKRNLMNRAKEKLASVGLAERSKHAPSELSGGEQQRTAIARALVNDPLIIFADEPTGNLDVKSKEEIMGILKDLNTRGKTIIMVTHEREIADRADRIVTMCDGRIVSDERTNPHQTDSPVKDDFSIKTLFGKRSDTFKGVEFAEHLRQSFRAICSNKARSFLSMLGILFGVGAVIAMLALGQGAQESMEARLRSLGSNLLMIRSGSGTVRGVHQAAGSVTRLTHQDVDAIRKLKPDIEKASGYVRGNAQVIYRNANWNTRVEGVGYDFGEMRASIPELGRWFSREEILRRERVAVLGITVAERLFGEESPVGKSIRINRGNFTVIGVAPEKGHGGWRDRDDMVYVPLTTAMYRLLGKDYLDNIYAQVTESVPTEAAEKRIRELIISRHRIRRNPEDHFHIRDMSEIQEMLESTTRTMGALLGSIAAISLLVGGIGIMNIMLVSVTERTREIGLRKALGARSKDIMGQFLIESVVMTLSGGGMGVILGISAAALLSFFAGWATKVNVSNIFLAAGFSIAVGIFFGMWPAKKAAALNPIEALRYE